MDENKEVAKNPAGNRYQIAGIGLILGSAVGFAIGGPIGAGMGAGVGLVLGAAIDSQRRTTS